jgi:hypothetical protein
MRRILSGIVLASVWLCGAKQWTIASRGFTRGGCASSPPTLRGSNINSSSTAVTSLTVTLPAGTVSGDFAVLYANAAYSISAPSPSGWTSGSCAAASGAIWNTWCGTKVMTSTDISAGGETVTAGGAFDMVAAIAVFVGGTSGVREIESTNYLTATNPLVTSSAVIPTDVGVYWNSFRGGGSVPTIVPSSCSVNVLQTASTTNARSTLADQQMPAGVNSITYDTAGNGTWAQIIVEH